MKDSNEIQSQVRWLSWASLLLAILGGGFYWWLPMGIVLSLAGMLFGFVDWTAARRRSLDSRLAVVGMSLSALALILCSIIAALGWQTVTFGR